MIQNSIRCNKLSSLSIVSSGIISLLLSCLILGGLFYPVTIFAKTTVENSEGLLKRLDRTIEEKTSLRLRYLNNLQQLKSKAVEQKGEKLIETYQQLFRAYAHFQSDSALAYLDLIEENVKDSKRAFELLQWTRIGRAEVYGVMGLYKSAANLLENTSVSADQASLQLYYYQVARSVYGWMMVRSEKIAKFSNS